LNFACVCMLWAAPLHWYIQADYGCIGEFQT
jgi:hypothetical protein